MSRVRSTIRSRWPALAVLVAIVAAPFANRAIAGEYPSEEWSPNSVAVGMPTSPDAGLLRVATLPPPPTPTSNDITCDAVGPVFPTFAPQLPPTDTVRIASAPVFGAPPIQEDGWPERPVVGTTPVCLPVDSAPTCNPWRPHSSFLPSLGRYGLIAPRTPGVESVHSAYVVAPPCRPSAPCANLFQPPPCADGGACGPGGCVSTPTGSATTSVGGNVAQTPPPCAPPGGDRPPCIDPRAQVSPYDPGDFSPDPCGGNPYDPCAAQGVYGDKHLNPTQRPLIEWGMPFYDTGPVPPPSLEFGPTNPSLPRFYLYGDYRSAAAYNDQNGVDKGVLAQRLNLEWDLWITSTERFHMFTGPLQRGNNFQRVEFNDGDAEFFNEMDFFNADTDTAFFEGDLGYMLGGWTGKYAQFDMPFTVGLIPLLFQNGVWMEDAIVGAAATIPARNNPYLDWSNYDITFFAGFDQVTSPAFDDNPGGPHVFGATTFIEAKGGYIEVGYAYLDDSDNVGRSYSNVGISYTRRYLNLLSNSMRVILNSGQSGPTDERTANGVLLIAENSFLTPWPYNVIPYINVWTGIDNPQSVARAGAAGGVLRNTGILFESDNLTGYPTLDATAANTYGAAFGLDLLSPEFTHQLVLEAAIVEVYGDPDLRNAAGNEFGLGARYQVPLSNATLLRFDAMHGFLQNADDVSGIRAEFRWKF